jgi:hypothetical protein
MLHGRWGFAEGVGGVVGHYWERAMGLNSDSSRTEGSGTRQFDGIRLDGMWCGMIGAPPMINFVVTLTMRDLLWYKERFNNHEIPNLELRSIRNSLLDY